MNDPQDGEFSRRADPVKALPQQHEGVAGR